MRAEQVAIEITRRCNMKCGHCMRGGAQRVDIDMSHVRSFLSNFTEIYALTFSGGEPTLKSELICNIIDEIMWRGMYIGSFYIVTNGLKYSQDLVDKLNTFYNYCGEQDICGLAVSRDAYHQEFYKDRIFAHEMMYEDYCEFYRPYDKNAYKGKYADPYMSRSLIKSGRAKEFGEKDPHRYIDKIEVEDSRVEGMLYLNALGDVIDDCDLSYVDQKKYKICRYDEISDYLDKKEASNGLHA